MNNNEPREERRRHVRLKQGFPVQIAFRFQEKDNQETAIEAASILNISSSGVCIEMEGFNDDWKDDLLFGRVIIALKIDFPGKEDPISVLAKAVWITKNDDESQSAGQTVRHLLGARFVEIASEEEAAITHYIVNHFL